MSDILANTPVTLPTILARQPVFDREGTLWGHELLFRRNYEDNSAVFTDANQATLTVAAGMFSAPWKFFHCSRRILLNFGQQSILEKVPYAFPHSQTIIQVNEDITTNVNLLTTLIDLKKDGYTIAIDNFSGRANPKVLLDLIDMVIIDVLDKAITEVEQQAQQAKQFSKALLLAKKVETKSMHNVAKDLGFHLFQGFFFKRPEILAGNTLTSHQASRIELLAAIEQPEPAFKELAQRIQADVSIGYRLLSYLNSPAFGFTQPIRSIKQAIALLGWKQLRNWLRVILITDLDSGDACNELAFLSVQRGKFLEWTALNHVLPDQDPDSLFLLGLFSLLEPMLRLPMQEIILHLPLAREVKDALCRENNLYTPWLDMVTAIETADWDSLDALAEQLGLNRSIITIAYYESIAWANTFFRYTRPTREA